MTTCPHKEQVSLLLSPQRAHAICNISCVCDRGRLNVSPVEGNSVLVSEHTLFFFFFTKVSCSVHLTGIHLQSSVWTHEYVHVRQYVCVCVLVKMLSMNHCQSEMSVLAFNSKIKRMKMNWFCNLTHNKCDLGVGLKHLCAVKIIFYSLWRYYGFPTLLTSGV